MKYRFIIIILFIVSAFCWANKNLKSLFISGYLENSKYKYSLKFEYDKTGKLISFRAEDFKSKNVKMNMKKYKFHYNSKNDLIRFECIGGYYTDIKYNDFKRTYDINYFLTGDPERENLKNVLNLTRHNQNRSIPINIWSSIINLDQTISIPIENLKFNPERKIFDFKFLDTKSGLNISIPYSHKKIGSNNFISDIIDIRVKNGEYEIWNKIKKKLIFLLKPDFSNIKTNLEFEF